MMIIKYAVFAAAVLVVWKAAIVQAESAIQEKVLFTDTQDINGDGRKEKVILKGVEYKTEEEYYKRVSLLVEKGLGWKELELGSGYKPEVSFADINRDGLQDVFLTKASDREGGDVSVYLCTFTDGRMRMVEGPPPVMIFAQFLNGYKAEVAPEKHRTVTLDLSSRKERYDRLGFYQNGVLNEPLEVPIEPYFSMKIVRKDEKQQLIEGIQKVSGAAGGEVLAEVISQWEYKKGGWKLKNVKVKEEEGKKAR